MNPEEDKALVRARAKRDELLAQLKANEEEIRQHKQGTVEYNRLQTLIEQVEGQLDSAEFRLYVEAGNGRVPGRLG